MREIKFRAWNGKMKRMFSAEEMAEDQLTLLSTGQFINVHGGSTKLSVIYPLDAMLPLQYTGLKDKNGNEIYEGYLLKKEDAEKPRIVKWTDQNGAYFVLSNSATEKVDWDDCLTDERINTYGYEIIGNIYENPELLNG